MVSVFNEMMDGKRRCHKLAEKDGFFACLEPKPITEGHAIVFPKKEVDAFFDLSDEEIAALMRLAKRTAAAIQKTVRCKKIALVVYGMKVRHAHLHLIPANGADRELDFFAAKAADDAELAETARRIVANL